VGHGGSTRPRQGRPGSFRACRSRDVAGPVVKVRERAAWPVPAPATDRLGGASAPCVDARGRTRPRRGRPGFFRACAAGKRAGHPGGRVGSAPGEGRRRGGGAGLDRHTSVGTRLAPPSAGARRVRNTAQVVGTLLHRGARAQATVAATAGGARRRTPAGAPRSSEGRLLKRGARTQASVAGGPLPARPACGWPWPGSPTRDVSAEPAGVGWSASSRTSALSGWAGKSKIHAGSRLVAGDGSGQAGGDVQGSRAIPGRISGPTERSSRCPTASSLRLRSVTAGRQPPPAARP
jgi:hypothetical protein